MEQTADSSRSAPGPEAPPAPDSPAAPAPGSRLPWRLLVLLALFPSVLAVAQLGRIHPDEVYQTLEPAYWRAHGYGVLAWEWRAGMRNWAVPLLLSWLLRLCRAVGVDHPLGYRAALELPQYLLNLWALAAAYRYGARRVGPAEGWIPVTLVACYGAWLAFAGRTLSESFSASFLLIALEALDRPGEARRPGLLAGLALGLSVVTRYGSAVFVAAALGGLAARRQGRLLGFTCLAGAGVAAGLAALDWATWGKPFHSFFTYAQFNVFSGQAAAQFGASPPGFYLPLVLASLPGWLWPAAAWALFRQRRPIPAGLLWALAYLLALSATAHKEARFLYPALLLAVLCAAPALARALRSLPSTAARRGALALAGVAGLLPLASNALYTDLRGDQFHAIVRATRDVDAQGLLIVGDGLWGVGGFFYVGKPIPWLTCDFAHDANFQLALRDPRFNRAIAFEGRTVPELEEAGFRVVGRLGRETLLARP